MKIKNLLPLLAATIILTQFNLAHAAIQMIPVPGDLPPGTMSYGNLSKGTGIDPNILAAIIGVIGLFMGTFLTLLGTYFLRFLDVKREDKREELFLVRERKEKEYQLKQEIYKNFLTELGHLESFLLHKVDHPQLKDIEAFNGEWTKMEIKMNLVCTAKIRQLLDEAQEDLMDTAKKRFSGSGVDLSADYLKHRSMLLDAIRTDIDLFQIK